MALVLADRVQETSTTTGTGTFTLDGAVSGYVSFAAIGNGNTTYYTIVSGTQWEVGVGTYTASGTTLSRDTVLSSSNNNTLVDFPAGSKTVFVTYPAERAVYENATGEVVFADVTATNANVTTLTATSVNATSEFTATNANVTTLTATNANVTTLNVSGTAAFLDTVTAEHINPSTNNTYDLGTSSVRWRNIYTNDLHLSNGIGDYTMVEGEEDLFLYNNKTGKVFKFLLAEVKPEDAPPKARRD